MTSRPASRPPNASVSSSTRSDSCRKTGSFGQLYGELAALLNLANEHPWLERNAFMSIMAELTKGSPERKTPKVPSSELERLSVPIECVKICMSTDPND